MSNSNQCLLLPVASSNVSKFVRFENKIHNELFKSNALVLYGRTPYIGIK